MIPLSVLLFGLYFILGQPPALESSICCDHLDGDHQHKRTTMPLNNTNPLTSHVLDTALGRPASGLQIVLYKQNPDQSWLRITEQLTNADGRVGNLITGQEFTPGVYKLYFDTLSYYKNRGEKTFYPFVEVVFEIEKPEEHYHVPILLSAYGYSTYRGS